MALVQSQIGRVKEDSWLKGSSISVKNLKLIVDELILIAPKNCLDALNATEKPSDICDILSMEKIRITSPKYIGFLQNRPFFLQTSSEMVIWNKLIFLHSIHCIKTFLLSFQNQLLDNFSDFHLKGRPFDLGGLKLYLQVLKVLNKSN